MDERTTSDPAIRTEGLTRRYGQTVAVRDLDLSVPRGSVLGLVGPNGAGKTTTIKLLLGLARPTAGRAEVLGFDAITQSLEVRRRTGYAPENDAVYGWMTVRDALDFCRGLYPTWDRERAGRCLDLFGLAAGQRVAAMSRGMRRQLALVLAVAARPQLLLLDEPTEGLDPDRRRDFFGVILEDVAADGSTVLISSHQLHEVERVADRVAFLRAGRLVREGSLDSIKETERQVRVVFQGAPPPDLAAWPELGRAHAEGRTWVLAVRGDLHAVLARLRALNPFALEVVERNLEDLYFSLGREADGDAHPPSAD